MVITTMRAPTGGSHPHNYHSRPILTPDYRIVVLPMRPSSRFSILLPVELVEFGSSLLPASDPSLPIAEKQQANT